MKIGTDNQSNTATMEDERMNSSQLYEYHEDTMNAFRKEKGFDVKLKGRWFFIPKGENVKHFYIFKDEVDRQESACFMMIGRDDKSEDPKNRIFYWEFKSERWVNPIYKLIEEEGKSSKYLVPAIEGLELIEVPRVEPKADTSVDKTESIVNIEKEPAEVPFETILIRLNRIETQGANNKLRLSLLEKIDLKLSATATQIFNNHTNIFAILVRLEKMLKAKKPKARKVKRIKVNLKRKSSKRK